MPLSLCLSVATLALALQGALPQGVREVALSASSSPQRGVLGEALSAASGAEALRDAALGALAPAPDTVVRTTRSFGVVTIDHRAHLARKAHCNACHDPGPVTKIVYTPRIAHERCISCHRDQQAGPTRCRECHEVKPPPKPETLQAAAGTLSATDAAAGAQSTVLVTASATGALTRAGIEASPLAATTTPAVETFTLAYEMPIAPERRFTRVISAGITGSRGAGPGTSQGPAIYVSARQDGYVLSLSFEAPDRTFGLLGAGAVFRILPRINALALGVGGFDAATKPSLTMMPALGGRVGVEWLGDRATVGLSMTGMSDLVRKTDAFGNSMGGVTIFFAASVGCVIN